MIVKKKDHRKHKKYRRTSISHVSGVTKDEKKTNARAAETFPKQENHQPTD